MLSLFRPLGRSATRRRAKWRREETRTLGAPIASRNLAGIRTLHPLFPTQEGGEGRGEESALKLSAFSWATLVRPLPGRLPSR